MVSIKAYERKYRQGVLDVHYHTGFLGKSMESILPNRKIWAGDAAIYIDKEPQHCFVAVDKDKVVGYTFCSNTNHDTLPKILSKTFGNALKSIFLDKKTRKWCFSRVSWLIDIVTKKSKELEFSVPPKGAELHINLLPEYRGKGVGEKLIHKLTTSLKKEGVTTVAGGSFKTKLNPNSNFFTQNGAEVYSKVQTTFWKAYLPNENMELVCYTKQI